MFGIFKKKKQVEIKSPVAGKSIELSSVPDEVFASKMVGDGIAFEPSEGAVYSPVDGEIVNAFPTKHAVGIRTPDGLEILIHIGIDTVNMKGEGFTSFIVQNQQVKAGEKLVEFDMELIKSYSYSTLIPVIITNMSLVEEIEHTYGEIQPGETAMLVKLK